MSTRITRSRGIGLSNSCTNPMKHLNANKLPDLAVRQVLKDIPDSDQCSTILNCRLVCTQWNKIIEDTSALMKKITFQVRDPKSFLDLPIVKKGKIKSIKIIEAWPLNSTRSNQQLTKKFIDTINKTVEKVEFAFNGACIYDGTGHKLFHLILTKCENIQELIMTQLLFRTFTQVASKIKSADKIESVLFKRGCDTSYQETQAVGMIKLLLKLPKLKEIKFDGHCEANRTMLQICEGLLEYLKKFGHALQLKELTLPLNSCPIFVWLGLGLEGWNILNSLLVQCGKYSIVVDGLPLLNFNSLLTFPEISSRTLLNQQRPLFNGKVNGTLTFELASVFSNLDLLGTLDIQQLRLLFEREVIQRELNWIANLKNLEILSLVKDEGLQSIGELEFEQAFSAGLVSLKELKVSNFFFGSTRALRCGEYFPNLTKLFLYNWKNTTNDLIAELTVLEFLTTLELCLLPNLDDLAFTSEHLNRISGLFCPAIACFKSLKDLEINRCPKLTNACVVNGIAKCGTLEKLTIFTCKNMTDDVADVEHLGELQILINE